MKTCRTCKHAEWGRGPSGRVRITAPGWCNYHMEIPPMPLCVDRRAWPPTKGIIYWDDARECETWESK